MNALNMPGFTAEASLYNVNERYQAIADTPHYGDIVQPAISIVDLVGLKFCWHKVCIRLPDGTGKDFEVCYCP